MEILVKREIFNDECTIGSLFINDKFECYSLEDPVREIEGVPVESWKIKGKTAIPRGRYRVIITHSKRFGKDLPELENVPGFTKIRIHGGNTSKDTEGCILLGQMRGNNSLVYSQMAMKLFMPILKYALTNDEECWVTVE